MIRKKGKVKALVLAVTCAILAGGYSGLNPVYAADMLYKDEPSNVYTASGTGNTRTAIDSLRIGDITINAYGKDKRSIDSVGSDGTPSGTISINGFNFDYDASKQITFTGTGIKIGEDTTVAYADLSGVVSKTQKISYDDTNGTVVDGKLSLKNSDGTYSSVNDAVVNTAGIKRTYDGLGYSGMYYRTSIEGLSITSNGSTIYLYEGDWQKTVGSGNASMWISRDGDKNGTVTIPRLYIDTIKNLNNSGEEGITFADLKNAVNAAEKTTNIYYDKSDPRNPMTTISRKTVIQGYNGSVTIDEGTVEATGSLKANDLVLGGSTLTASHIHNINNMLTADGKISSVILGNNGSKVGDVTFTDGEMSGVTGINDDIIRFTKNGSKDIVQINSELMLNDDTGKKSASLTIDNVSALDKLLIKDGDNPVRRDENGKTIIDAGNTSTVGGVKFSDSSLDNVKSIKSNLSGIDILFSNDASTNNSNTTTIESTLSVSEKIAAGNYGNLAINAGEANQVKIGKNGIAVGKNSSHMDADNGFYTDKNLYVGSGHVYDDATSTLTKAPTEENSKFFVDGTDGHLKAANGNFTVDKDGNVVSNGTLTTTGNISTNGSMTAKGGISAAGGKFQVDSMNGRVYANAGLTVNGDLHADSAFIAGRINITNTGAITGVSSITTDSLTVNGTQITNNSFNGATITNNTFNGAEITNNSFNGVTMNNGEVTGNSFTAGSSLLKDGELKLNDANTWTTAEGIKAEKVTIGTTTIEGGKVTTKTLDVEDIILRNTMQDGAGNTITIKGSDGSMSVAGGKFAVDKDGHVTNKVGNTTLKTDANGAGLSYNGSVKSEVSVADGKVNVSAGAGSIGIANGEIKSAVGSNASSTINADKIVDMVGKNSVTTDATGTTFNNGSSTTNINGNTITTGKLITDELVIKGGTPGSGGSFSIGGDGTIKSDVKDGSNHTTFETSKTGTTTVSKKDGAKTENKVEASGNTNTVTKGADSSKSSQTATSIGGVVTNGEVSMKQELTTNGLKISDEKDDPANYTQITNKDVSIADPNNAGKRINLSDLGKLGDLGDLNDEITSHEEYTKNSTAVGAINAEAKIRQEEVNRLDNRIDDISGRINDVSNRVDKVGAMAAAIASLKTMGYDPQAPSEFSVGLGHYKGETGVALGFFHYPNKNFMINVSLSTAGGETMGGIGATWRFGHKSPQKLLDEQRATQAKHF